MKKNIGFSWFGFWEEEKSELGRKRELHREREREREREWVKWMKNWVFVVVVVYIILMDWLVILLLLGYMWLNVRNICQIRIG